jgi:hypothetical protein
MYQLAGTINTIMVFISLIGVFSQLRVIWQRKHDPHIPQSTDLLSLNQFCVSFLAYYSFFIYGYSVTPFNHFMVWPRLLAATMILLILLEIMLDRKTKSSHVVFIVALASLVIGLVGLMFNQQFNDVGKQVSAALIVTITICLAQGYYHQIMLIVRNQRTGAVDIKMSQFIFMMDLSTIAFALTMPITQSWPLILLASVSGITKLIIMYLFRWLRINQSTTKEYKLNQSVTYTNNTINL